MNDSSRPVRARPPTPKPRYTIAGTLLLLACSAVSSAAAADRLIDLLPADTIVALHIERPQRALVPSLIKPIAKALAPDAAAARRWVEAVKRIPGPLLIGRVARRGTRDLSKSDWIVAMELRSPDVKFDELVADTFLPLALAAARLEKGGIRLDRGAVATRVFVQGIERPVFAYAVRDGLVLGSTDPQAILRWARGAWPERRWVNAPGVKKLLGGLPRHPSARILFNPAPLIRVYSDPEPRSSEALALEVLAPQDVKAAAVDLTWERTALVVRATVVLADECEGLARLLARPATAARTLGIFPEDFLAVGRIGFASAADIVGGAYAVTDRFDKTISAEYRQESAEFHKETGVNIETDLLANLVGEAAFGVRVNFTARPPIAWAVVFPLADEAGFDKASSKLIEHYGLTFDTGDQDDITIRTAIDTFPFAMAAHRGVLVVAGDAATAARVAARAGVANVAVPAGENMRRCYEAMPQSNQLAIVFDVEQLRKSVPILPVLVGPKFAPLLGRGTIGLSMTVKEHVARIEARWDLGDHRRSPKDDHKKKEADSIGGEHAMVVLTEALTASLVQARRQAMRIVSMSQMRGLGHSLFVYAEKHGGAFPEDLAALVKADPALLEMLVSPYDGRGPKTLDEIPAHTYLIYRRGLHRRPDPPEIILAEREAAHADGANFLFTDGHVEFIREPRASELIELIRQGAEQVRR